MPSYFEISRVPWVACSVFGARCGYVNDALVVTQQSVHHINVNDIWNRIREKRREIGVHFRVIVGAQGGLWMHDARGMEKWRERGCKT